MRRALLLLSIPLAVLAYETAEQTDWSGGDGVPGPVTDWGDTFDTAADVNWSGSPGEIYLARIPLGTPVEHLVCDDFGSADSIYAADVDGDGDIDVLGAAYSNKIHWWENLDGWGTSWFEHNVSNYFFQAAAVYAADVDGDGDMDILGAASDSDEIAWWENLDGGGTSWTKYTVNGNFDGACSVYAADVDGDDDVDILGAASDADVIACWLNDDGSGTSWTECIVADDFNGASSVSAADVDGDGDTDILGAAHYADDITWWENLGGSGTSWTEHTVEGDFIWAISVYAADVDGDEDMDILGAAYEDADITWWENVDGSGTSWTEHLVEDWFWGANSVYATDMDGDEDIDILGAADHSDDIIWWENSDGSGTSWTAHNVDLDFEGAYSVYAADVNGDDVTDVLGAAFDAFDITWWRVIGYGTGELTSSILDTGGASDWGVCEWLDHVPTGTSLTVEARASDDAGSMGDWVEITEGDLSDYLPDGLRYLQYRVGLESATGGATPTFNWIRFTWSEGEAVDDVELSASAADDGIIIDWTIQGDFPVGLRVLREVNSDISPLHTDALPGSATRYLDRNVQVGEEYRYWLETVDALGVVERFGPTEAVRIEPGEMALSLSEPYPSPASDSVTIAFTLPDDGPVELAIYDLAGRRVATLENDERTAGRHEVSWNCGDIPSGVYLYRLETVAGSLTQRLVISR